MINWWIMKLHHVPISWVFIKETVDFASISNNKSNIRNYELIRWATPCICAICVVFPLIVPYNTITWPIWNSPYFKMNMFNRYFSQEHTVTIAVLSKISKCPEYHEFDEKTYWVSTKIIQIILTKKKIERRLNIH